MGYAMIWAEVLAVAAVWVALVAVLVGRWRSRAWGIVLVSAAALLPLVIAGGLTLLAGAYQRWLGWGWFAYGLAWIVVYVPAAGVIGWLGLRPEAGLATARAATWPRARIILALAGLATLFMITLWNMDLAMCNRLAMLRSEAGALALSVAPARVPDRDNAAPLYREAFAAMARSDDQQPAWNEDWASWLGDGQVPFDPADPALREYLAQQAPALGLVREASARPGCYFDRDYGRPGLDMLLPEIGHFRAAARLLAIAARVRAASGDGRGALADVAALYRMAGHVENEPILISMLVAIATEETGLRTLEAILASGAWPAGDLAALDPGPSHYASQGLGRAFRMEEAFALGIFADMSRPDALAYLSAVGGGGKGLRVAPLTVPLGVVWRVFLLPADVDGYRRSMHEYQRLAAMPYHEARDLWARAADEIPDEPGGILTAMLFPALGRCAEVAVRADARRSLARAALAAARFRAARSRYPETLEELVPEFLSALPRDPFDGKPLRMAARDGGAVLYSIGPDGKDDGGAAWDKHQRTGDLTFRLGPAALKARQPPAEGP